jgi:short-subunit dehydrogenase
MKIAITGHSAGIGKSLSKAYEKRGHEIVGLSRRNGNNIRSLPKILNPIKDCDMLINNAQHGFGQTELLFEVFKMWQDQKNKFIINISSMMTLYPISSIDGLDMDLYRLQKVTLEEAFKQLLYKSGPRLIMVKPGAVATQPNQTSPKHADPDEWAETLVSCLESVGPNLKITEIALGVNRG